MGSMRSRVATLCAVAFLVPAVSVALARPVAAAGETLTVTLRRQSIDFSTSMYGAWAPFEPIDLGEVTCPATAVDTPGAGSFRMEIDRDCLADFVIEPRFPFYGVLAPIAKVPALEFLAGPVEVTVDGETRVVELPTDIEASTRAVSQGSLSVGLFVPDGYQCPVVEVGVAAEGESHYSGPVVGCNDVFAGELFDVAGQFGREARNPRLTGDGAYALYSNGYTVWQYDVANSELSRHGEGEVAALSADGNTLATFESSYGPPDPLEWWWELDRLCVRPRQQPGLGGDCIASGDGRVFISDEGRWVAVQPWATREIVLWDRTDNTVLEVYSSGAESLEGMSERGIPVPTTSAGWDAVSAQLASGAKGDVIVLQQVVREQSTWFRIEFRALKLNPNVTSITAVDPATGARTVLWIR